MADWFRWHGRAVAKCAHLWFAWRQHATAKLDPTSTKLRRAAVLDVVQCYPWYLKYVPAELRADPEVVMAAVKHGGYALQYASVGLRADRDIVLEAMQQYAGHPKYRERLRFVARATSIIVSCGLICWLIKPYAYLVAYLYLGHLFFRNCVASDNGVVRCDINRLRHVCSDKRRWTLELGKGKYFRYASPTLRANRTFVLAAVELSRGYAALQYVSAELQADPALDRLRKQMRRYNRRVYTSTTRSRPIEGLRHYKIGKMMFTQMNLARDRDALGAAVGVRTIPAPHAALNGALSLEVLPMVYWLIASHVEEMEGEICASLEAQRWGLHSSAEVAYALHLHTSMFMVASPISMHE